MLGRGLFSVTPLGEKHRDFTRLSQKTSFLRETVVYTYRQTVSQISLISTPRPPRGISIISDQTDAAGGSKFAYCVLVADSTVAPEENHQNRTATSAHNLLISRHKFPDSAAKTSC